MKNDCVFKRNDQNGSCRYGKLIKVCMICTCYLKHDDNLEKDIKYLQFVADRNNQRITFLISITSLIISIATLTAVLIKLFIDVHKSPSLP